MSTFKSTININKPVSEIYQFLTDMNNHQQLMPDTIQNWTSTVNEASFSIPNMVKLFLKIEDRVPDKEIKIVPAVKPPFDIEIKWQLTNTEDNTEVLLVIEADLNMMMKMVASGPLQKLADTETANLYTSLN